MRTCSLPHLHLELIVGVVYAAVLGSASRVHVKGGCVTVDVWLAGTVQAAVSRGRGIGSRRALLHGLVGVQAGEDGVGRGFDFLEWDGLGDYVLQELEGVEMRDGICLRRVRQVLYVNGNASLPTSLY